MTRWLVLSGALLWAGATLLLTRLRWFVRPTVLARLQPHAPARAQASSRAGVLSVESFVDLIEPVSRAFGERLSAILGLGDDLAVRLRRIHSPLDLTAFRVRQIGWTLAALGGAALLVVAVRPPAAVTLACLVGGPLLAFLLSEQQVALASARWQRSLFLELPVVAEQLAMLLSAGYSLTTALNRVASRGRGACAADLARVCARVRQGVGEQRALEEWASVAQVDAVDRVVAVLALSRETTDLGRLLSEEAKAIRADVHRELVERMERRAQQVWIPVTVATLLPGVVFMLVPFLEALRQFG